MAVNISLRKYLHSKKRRDEKRRGGYDDRPTPAQFEEIQSWFAGKEFTSDWLTNKLGPWFVSLDPLRSRAVDVLDVGSYEGRSAVVLLSLLPNSHVTSIDTFLPDHSDDEALHSVSSSEVEARFDYNLQTFGSRVTKVKDFAANALDRLASKEAKFDVIYIDAAKRRDGVYALSALSWPLLKEEGVIIWDDLIWRADKPSSERPGDAIRFFCTNFAGCLKILHEGHQMIARKISQWPDEALGAP